jgi:hypothetical protein
MKASHEEGQNEFTCTTSLRTPITKFGAGLGV